MKKRSYVTDLDFSNSRPGTRVRCVQEPDLEFWYRRTKEMRFEAPVLGNVYQIRATVRLIRSFVGLPGSGVLLREIRNDVVPIHGIIHSELFFPFSLFTVVSRP